jgi:tetratricopeptide (TPR) repeat protein
MRKINGKLFLGLLLGTVVLTGSVFAVHHFQYQRIARALLWQARRAEEQGQPRRAAQYLQRYLEFNPRDNDEKANLARTWAGDEFAGNVRARRGALSLMDEVLIYEDRPDLRRLLVKVALEEGGPRRTKQARDHLARLMPWPQVEDALRADAAERQQRRAVPAPRAAEERQQLADRGELEGYWGQVMEADKKTAEAAGCYRLAVRHAPELQDNYVRLAYLLRRAREDAAARRRANLAEADQALDALVAHNPTSHQAFLARWRYRREFDLLCLGGEPGPGQVGLEDAAEDVAAALQRKAEAVEVLLAAADLERLNSRAAAEDVTSTPEQREKGLAEHRRRAFEHLKRGLDVVSQQAGPAADNARFQLLWHKANLLLDDLDRLDARQGSDPEAGRQAELEADVKETIAQLERSRVPAAADYLRGRMLVHERKWNDAVELLERARTVLSGQADLASQANLYLGQCYEKLEEPGQMFEAYNRVATLDPSSVQARLGMAAARWAQERYDEAYTLYAGVLKGARVPPRVCLDMARLEIQMQVRADKPDWAKAEKAVARAQEANPDAPVEVALMRAELLVRQKKADEAEKLLRAARKANPKEVELTTALADLAVGQKKFSRAQALLTEGQRELGDGVTLRLARARLVVASAGEGAKAKLGELTAGLERFSEDDQARLLNGLAEAQFRAGQRAAAVQLWQRLAGLPRQRNDLRLRLLLFDLALQDGDEPGMEQALADIRRVEQSSGAYHRYGQALRLIWQVKKGKVDREAGLKQARLELDRVLSQRPSWPPVFLARAEIAELQGNPEQAIKDYREAIKNGDGSLTVVRRLVTLLAGAHRDKEAEEELKRVRDALLNNSDLGRVAVGVALRERNMQRALDLAARQVSQDTQDPKDLVWMARVLALAGKPGEAEEKLKAARRVAGNDPEPWVATVQFLAERGRKEAARQALEEAKKNLPREERAMALGRCYHAVGEAQEAQRQFEEALRAKRDAGRVRAVAAFHLAGGRLPEAEKLLRELVAKKDQEGWEAHADWARRSLAMVLASGTDFQRFREAAGLVGVRLGANGRLAKEETADLHTEELRARARVLASQAQQRQFRKKAIAILEGLAARQAVTPDDQYVLALLHEQEGNSQKARQNYEGLVKQREAAPQYLAQYAMTLIAQRRPGDLERAAELLQELEAQERRSGGPPNQFAAVELRARLLEARGKGKEAEGLLRKHTAREGARPEEVLLVLASLGRQKRYKEAFALCEQVWREGKVAPEAVGGVSVALLRVMGPSDAQVKRVEGRLRKALEKKKDSVVLRMHLADLYDKRGRYPEAERLYREVLEREKNNIVALNNLAWLLAQRTGKAEEALTHIDAAVKGLGRRPDLLDTRGLVHLARNQTDQALADFREATEEAPTPTRLYHLAKAYHQARKRGEAAQALRDAKSKGLKVAALHPVEQDAARRLLAEYGLVSE